MNVVDQQTVQVFAVLIFLQWNSQLCQLLLVNESISPSDLFGAGDLESLPVLERRNEVPRFEQAFVRAGIQPGIATLHDLDVQCVCFSSVWEWVSD